MKKRILLITGKPGIGKTTLLRKVAAELEQCRIGGFYTEEIRELGQRKGFQLVTFSGESAVIAHVKFEHRYRIGKYGVDISVIDHFADSTMTPTKEVDLYVIDEIGKMECLSEHFVSRMRQLLESDKTIVASVAKHGGGLIETVKQWPESDLWEINYANRDLLPSRVVDWLQNRVARG